MSKSLQESQAELNAALADLGASLRSAVPTWLPRHAWWLQAVCGFALLGFATYMLLIDEVGSAAMLAGLVVFLSVLNLRRR